MTKMNFNGQWIDNLYVDPHRGLGPGVENTTVKVGQSTGETFLHSTKNKRMIVVDYQIYGSTRRELELTLADKLYTDDVVPIIFSDKPNEVWYGKLDELPTMEKPGVSATGTFSLLVPDGLSHALTPTTATNMPYKDVPVNMLVDSGFESGNVPSVTWGPSAIGAIAASSGGESLPTPFGKYMLKIDSNDASTVLDQFASYPLANAVSIKSGETWTYSYYYASAGSARGQASDYLLNGGNANPIFWLSMGHGNRITDGGQTAWHRFTATFTATADITVTHLRFGFVKIAASDHGWLCIDNINLKQEPIASPWSPNPADPEYYADTIELTNNGTVPTPIHVTAEMRSDNGFLGLTLDDNFYQLGNIDEVDAVQLPPSEMIVPDGLAAFGSGKINDTAHQPLPPLMGALSQTGTIVKDANGINVTDYGTSSAKSWAGPSITWTFPAASDGKIGAKNFFLWQNNEFETDKKPEAGFQVHTVADKDGKRLFTAILLDQSGITNQSKIICFVNDNKVYESDNQWTGKGYRGFMSMTKSGNNFVIVYGNTTKTFVDTALTDSEGYYYTVGYGKWYNNPAPAHNYVINWNLRQDKIDAWKDVPNFLKAGDVVDLDSKTNTLTINDYPDWDRVDIASEPLLVPPGKSTLGIVYSTFAKPPKVTVDFEERWL